MPRPDMGILRKTLWGKSDRTDNPDLVWLPLVTHLYDTASLADAVWERMLSDQSRRAIRMSGGMSEDRAKRVYRFLCGVHDVGKASTSFIHQNRVLHERIKSSHPSLPCHPDSTRVRHEIITHVSLVRWLLQGDVDSVDDDVFERVSSWCVPVGGHHGIPPQRRGKESKTDGLIVDKYSWEDAYCDSREWADIRRNLIDEMKTVAGLTDSDIAHMYDHPLQDRGQILLTSAIIVADWMASSETLHPHGIEAVLPSQSRTQYALERFGIPDVWKPTNTMEKHFKDTFAARFGGGAEGFVPRPVQQAVHEHIVAHAPVHGAMFVLIEDATGSGKTEAGLSAAEMLAARSGARGVMVALPTMATSNAMFSRVQTWLSSIGQQGTFTTQLMHSSAALNKRFTDIEKVGMGTDPSTLCCHDSAAAVHSWMAGRNMSMMSDFNVGTIDSVISLALKRKLAVLPHLGLASKVLIIDEVHDSDEYMREFLLRILMWLGRYDVPVIALSATLTPTFRKQLHAAYMGEDPCGERDFGFSNEYSALDVRAYPLITSSSCDGDIAVTSNITSCERRKTMILTTYPDSGANVLVNVLGQNSKGEGCLAVVCNTASGAQEVFELLNKDESLKKDDWDIRLLHSRFTIEDRFNKESEIVDRLGKNGDRPKRMIVVGTQVLEQSLDIDFDLMVTEVAPLDVLIQRAGRLHRHVRDNRSEAYSSTDPQLCITGVPTGSEFTKANTSTVRIYGPSRVYMAIALLRERSTLTTPDDTLDLIRDSTDVLAVVPPEWEADLRQEVDSARACIRNNSNSARPWLIPPVDKDLDGLMKGWEPDGSGDVNTVRNSAMDRSVIVVVRKGDSLVFLKNHAVPVMCKTETMKNLPEDRVRDLAKQELRLTEELRGAVLPSVDDLVGEGYKPRWNPSRSRFVDHGNHVLILDEGGKAIVDVKNGDSVKKYTIEYTVEKGLKSTTPLRGNPVRKVGEEWRHLQSHSET